MGFSLVVEYLIEAKKTLIGHNLMYDIIYLYNQFIEDLPLTYKEFVTEVIFNKKPKTLQYSGISYFHQSLIQKFYHLLHNILENVI